MHITTLLSLLLTIATATLVRAEACPVPTAEGWVAEYDIPEGSTETVCYWSQCAALGGVAGWPAGARLITNAFPMTCAWRPGLGGAEMGEVVNIRGRRRVCLGRRGGCRPRRGGGSGWLRVPLEHLRVSRLTSGILVLCSGVLHPWKQLQHTAHAGQKLPGLVFHSKLRRPPSSHFAKPSTNAFP